MGIPDNYFVQAITKTDYESWLLHKHYAHRIPNVMYAFGLYGTDKGVVGVCTLGLPPQENCLLMCGQEYKNNAIELNRLVKNDDLPPNTQSWFVSQCFKYLPKPRIILSYADPNNGHQGYTYQALNFYYTGKGGAGNEYIYQEKQYTQRHIKDYWFAANKLKYDPKKSIKENFLNAGGTIIKMSPKNRYVYFLGSKLQKRDMLSKMKWPILPYPKGQNKRYDASYQPEIQKLLF